MPVTHNETPSVRRASRELTGEDMRFYLTEVGAMKAWAGDPIDQRDMRAIGKVLGLKTDTEAYEIVRKYSDGELSREVQILLESLFP